MFQQELQNIFAVVLCSLNAVLIAVYTSDSTTDRSRVYQSVGCISHKLLPFLKIAIESDPFDP